MERKIWEMLELPSGCESILGSLLLHCPVGKLRRGKCLFQIQALALPLACYVPLGKSLHQPEPLFSFVKRGIWTRPLGPSTSINSKCSPSLREVATPGPSASSHPAAPGLSFLVANLMHELLHGSSITSNSSCADEKKIKVST